ncbi:MAG: hypothetical protein RQ751_11370 [Longimicrobiales bacterium]|nr:hypothetical protein [Longimicrobiales bacterium]
MSILNPRSPAEARDVLATLTAAAVGVAALVYSVNVLEVFVPEGTAHVLGLAQIAGAVLILAVYAPMLVRLKRRGGRPEGNDSAGGSYLQAVFRQASSTAFSVLLVVLVVLSLLERTVLAHLTAGTAVDLIITLALTVLSLSYFFVNRFGRLG